MYFQLATSGVGESMLPHNRRLLRQMVVGRNEKFLSPTCKCPALCNPNEVTE